jgi:hypothetical protein
MSTLLSGSEAGPVGRGKLAGSRRLGGGLTDGVPAPAHWRYPSVAGELAKVCVTERRKLRYPHRRPTGAERIKDCRDVLPLRLLGRRLSASQAPGCRLDGFLVLIHSANDIANRLRCHDI